MCWPVHCVQCAQEFEAEDCESALSFCVHSIHFWPAAYFLAKFCSIVLFLQPCGNLWAKWLQLSAQLASWSSRRCKEPPARCRLQIIFLIIIIISDAEAEISIFFLQNELQLMMGGSSSSQRGRNQLLCLHNWIGIRQQNGEEERGKKRNWGKYLILPDNVWIFLVYSCASLYLCPMQIFYGNCCID